MPDAQNFVITEEILRKLEHSGPLGPTLRHLYEMAKETIELIQNDEDDDRDESLKKLLSYAISMSLLMREVPRIAGAGILQAPPGTLDGDVESLDLESFFASDDDDDDEEDDDY